MIKLTLPYPPSSNRYWRSRAYKTKTGTYAVNTYPSEVAKEYKDEIHMRLWVWKRRNPGAELPIKGEVGYRVKVFRPQKSGDLSNRLKVLEDALQGLIFLDDKQITEIYAERFDDKFDPRVEIEIYERSTMPLLDTTE